jgi:hypothetical protein
MILIYKNGLDEIGACLPQTQYQHKHLVQVLLHTNLVQLSTSCSLLLLGECVRPVGEIYTFTCTCIRLWCMWENYHKTNSCWTHSSKQHYFLTEIISVCDDK